MRQIRPTDLGTSTPSICTTTKLPNGVTRTGESVGDERLNQLSLLRVLTRTFVTATLYIYSLELLL